MAVAIVQHADSVNETTGYADLPAPATAGNLILVRLSTRPNTTTLAMDPGSGYTRLGQVDIAGERAGSAAIFAKNAAGGEQRIKRDLGFAAGAHVCAYEISGANVLSCELRSATHQTSATPFSLSAHTSATGLAFDLFIVTHNEGGVDRVWTGGSGNADWTEHHDGGPSGTGHNDGPWIWEGNATPTAAAITPTVSLTPPSGKTLSEWGGLSVQVSAPAAVVADFGVSPNPTTTGTTVTFTDASTGTPNQWAWDFGDAGTSTSQNPTHVYSAPGLYTITLTATRTSDSSSDSETKVWYVSIADAPEPGVFVDWSHDGFDNGTNTADGRLARALPEAGASASDNITADVISFEWTRGASGDHVGQPPPGTCTIIVQNTDGKYTPENSSGALYGRLRPGLPVWIGRNADGTLSGSGQTVHGVWAGYVRQIVPIPVAGATNTPTAEIICEDPLGYYARQPTRVADATGRSYSTLRTAVLDDIGEDDDRRDLATEPDTMPLSAADSESALRVLEALNTASGSRHSIEPADSKEDWYTYRTVTRHHKLGSATDFTLNADNIQATAGYRVTEENVNNYQVVEVDPLHLPAGVDTVWTHVDRTFSLTQKRTIWAQFDDFVKDAVLDYTSTGSAVTTVLSPFGTTAKIELWSAGTSVVQNLTIEGRQAIRDASERVTAEDAASQVAYGRKAGSVVSSEYVGSTALAQGLADFLVWKFGTARARMSVTITNLLSTVNGKTLYDTLALTFDRLYLTGKRFEIIGEQGVCTRASTTGPTVHWVTTYEIQETPNQAALSLFTLDTSTLDGSHVLAR